MPGLPNVPVEPQSEVIREHRVATPVSDAFSAWVAERRTGNAASGGEQTEGEWYARTRLGAWESLVTRMSTGWPPDGWYPVAFYQEDLALRDDLTQTATQLDGESAVRFAEALALVDDAFRVRTVEDRGTALAEATGLPRLELALRGWWWQRRPEPVPWPRPGE